MASFTLSLISRSCLLALTAGSCAAASADVGSPWRAIDGTTMKVTTGYSTDAEKDYPLFASGTGSRLETDLPGLVFNTSGNLLHAAHATAGGSLLLSEVTLTTNGRQAHGAMVDGGTLNLSGGNIVLKGDDSAGAQGRNDAALVVDDVKIYAEGQRSRGVVVDSGTLTLSDASIMATGGNSGGVFVGSGFSGSANAVLDDVDITLTSDRLSSGIELGNGELTGKKVRIATAGDSIGVNIYNGRDRFGTLALSDSYISTQKGDGIYIMRGKATLEETNVTTGTGKAVNLNTSGEVAIQGGSFTTQGNNADGLWIATSDSSATVNGATFTTFGDRSHAFNAQFGNALITDTSLNTLGGKSYGLYSEAQVKAQDLTVQTEGKGATGVFAARGGKISLERTSVTTTGDATASLLVYPGSTLMGNNVQVNSTGDSSYGLWAREGVLNLSNSQVAVQGQDSAGLFASNGGTGAGSQVTLDNVKLSSKAGPAIKTDATALDLMLRNGTQIISGNHLLLEDLAGEESSPGRVSIIADGNVFLQGDIRAATENQVNVMLSNTSQLTGAVQNVDQLSLDRSSTWKMTGDSRFGQFTNDGTVAFSHNPAGFSTLTVESLQGDGAFAMNTNIAMLRGDLINVIGQAHGNHLLYISDTGAEPQSAQALTVVKTGGGDEVFRLHGDAVDVGTWQYTLREVGDDWVLVQKSKEETPDTPDEGGGDTPDNGGGDTPDEGGGDTPDNGGGDTPDNGGGITPVPTPTTVTALGMFNATPTAWYGELTTLRTRMGEVRHGKQQGSAWVQLLGNHFNVSERAGTAYQQQQTGMAIGVDGTHPLVESHLMTGLFTGFSRSSLDFDHGSTGRIDSFFIGGYTTWLHQDGWFVDAVAKANNFNNHADARMTSGEKASGGYSVPAFGLSVEGGRQIVFGNEWFIEPSVQFSSVWVKGDDYTFSNQLHAQSGSVTSKQGALNMTGGKTFELSNGVMVQPWGRASVIQEFSADNAVRVNGHHFNNDMSGTRGEYAAGVTTQATETLQVYADVRYAKGDKIESPLGGSLGVRWTW